MKRISPTDRTRVETALAAMYRRPYLPPKDLIGVAAERNRCSRRQLERAFSAFGTGAATELRAIRCELAAACLVDPGWHDKNEQIIGRRVGLPDARAVRRVIASRWAVTPSGIREAASLHRHLCWAEAVAERRRVEWGVDRGGSSHTDRLRASLATLLDGAPIEIRRLIEADLRFPLPNRAAAAARDLARERVGRKWRARLHEAGLVA